VPVTLVEIIFVITAVLKLHFHFFLHHNSRRSRRPLKALKTIK